jgi:N-hydroxyarylamine O-acetyltransferase
MMPPSARGGARAAIARAPASTADGRIDLEAYLKRIRWRAPTSPTYDTLAGLLLAHMRAIPFENLDVLLGRGIHLDLPALQEKLIGARRGGYCFEHATLLAAVLESVGFAPIRHSARVVLFAPPTASPRTHMFLTVALAEGTFVLDPGFGGLAPAFPVPLADHPDAAPDGETHWMARDGGYWVLRARSDTGVVDCWVSTLEADNPVDFAVANHYTSTHPASPFVNRVTLRALTDDGRVTVMNRDVTLREAAASRTWKLADRAALRALLARHFGFDLPQVQSLRVPSIEDWR